MAKNTSFILGDHFDAFVAELVASGRYASATEVIRCGLRLLEEHEERRAALKEAIREGIESGPYVPFDLDAMHFDCGLFQRNLLEQYGLLKAHFFQLGITFFNQQLQAIHFAVGNHTGILSVGFLSPTKIGNRNLFRLQGELDINFRLSLLLDDIELNQCLLQFHLGFFIVNGGKQLLLFDHGSIRDKDLAQRSVGGRRQFYFRNELQNGRFDFVFVL